jgi:hypothetical protein
LAEDFREADLRGVGFAGRLTIAIAALSGPGDSRPAARGLDRGGLVGLAMAPVTAFRFAMPGVSRKAPVVAPHFASC